MKINIESRFKAAKQVETDAIRCPEIRGVVKGKGGKKIGSLTGNPFRVYSHPKDGWNVIVQFWKNDGDGTWSPSPAPLPNEDVGDNSEGEVFVTASDQIEGMILPRWILMEPETLAKSMTLREGWETPRRFPNVAQMEVRLFAEFDAAFEPLETQGAKAYTKAVMPTWDSFEDIETKLFIMLTDKFGSVKSALQNSAAAREFKEWFPNFVAEREAKEAKANAITFPEGKSVFQTSLFPTLAPGAFY